MKSSPSGASVKSVACSGMGTKELLAVRGEIEVGEERLYDALGHVDY